MSARVTTASETAAIKETGIQMIFFIALPMAAPSTTKNDVQTMIFHRDQCTK
jgi:hypothetical protein